MMAIACGRILMSFIMMKVMGFDKKMKGLIKDQVCKGYDFLLNVFCKLSL